MRHSHCVRVLLFLLLSTACEGAIEPTPDGGSAPFRVECENLNPAHCLVPWPSSRFLTEAPTATGFRLDIPVEAMPVNTRGVPTDPAQFHRFDGFSPMTSLVTTFPGPLDPATLHGEDALEATLAADSTTLIVDAETGALVAHFAELDEWPSTSPERAPLYLRPAARLNEGRRYIVGIRGLRTTDGSLVQPSAYFAALRDGREQPGTDIEQRRAHFEEIFERLASAGVPREELIEAWDFVTASSQTLRGDLMAMRDDAVGAGGDDFGRVTQAGLGCTVSRVEDRATGADLPDNVWRRVYGTITVPLYLQGEEASEEESRIDRDADGTPLARGTVEVPFAVQIPLRVRDTVAAGEGPAPLEIYGHGLFGSRAELMQDWHTDHQENLGVVSAGVDWWGMSELDLARIARTMRSFNNLAATGERLTQAVINTMVLDRSLRGICRTSEAMQVPVDSGGTAPAYDADRVYFYGVSAGGIFGGTVAGVSTDLERFVLGVGGIGFPLMIKRSTHWSVLSAIVETNYDDPFDADLLLVMTAPIWDLAEPATFAPHLVHDLLHGAAPKRILLQVSPDDAQVPALAAIIQARTAGIPLLTPAPFEPWGLDTTSGPTDSALVFYEVPGAPSRPTGTSQPENNSVAHDGVRQLATAQEQIRRFIAPGGRVEHVCVGLCDPD